MRAATPQIAGTGVARSGRATGRPPPPRAAPRHAARVPARRRTHKQHASRTGPSFVAAALFARAGREEVMESFDPNELLPETSIRGARDFGFKRNLQRDYQRESVIGKGSFGTVWRCTSRKTGESYAVKSMPKRFVGGRLDSMFQRRVENEVDVLRTLGNSLNVAYLYDVFEDDKNVDLVMEMCTGGELWARIEEGRYTEEQAAAAITDVLRAIAQCHAKGVLIRDVKPENFLYLHDGPDAPLKTIDFGMSVMCQPGELLIDRAGTVLYCAPELLRMSYGLPSDLWSAGIVAYQLLTGRLPFAGPWGSEVTELWASERRFDRKEAFRAILNAPLDFESEPWGPSGWLGDDCADLLQGLLERDPEKRLTALQALQHPWIKKHARRRETSAAGDESAEGAALHDSVVQRLQRFGTFGRLKQIALARVATAVAADDAELVQGLTEIFRELDPEGKGYAQYRDVLAALRGAGFDLSESEVQQMALQMDVDHDGRVEYGEWLASLLDWHEVQKSGHWREWTSRFFDQMDADHDGTIGREELGELLCGGTCPVPDELEGVMRELDRDRDGRISAEDFQAMMLTSSVDALEIFPPRLSQGGAEGGDGRRRKGKL
ncbi:unnamed protein product [Pedinophyceae sp. YPF-701]|nr:unnamed protein product [Pedinophyceae sp. YPF-701]